jgi:ABC-2 type transport system permease protein
MSHFAAPPRLKPYLYESGYEFLKTLRMPEFALPTLCFPPAFYTLFALLLPTGRGDFPAATWFLATMGAFGVIGPALFGFGANVALERQQGWLRLRDVTPAPPAAYLVAKLAMSTSFALVISLILIALATTFGGVRLSPERWVALLAVWTFGTLPFAALGLWIGLSFSGQSAGSIVQLIYLPLGALSGLWWPIFLMPEPLQAFAWLLPTFHLGQLALAATGSIQAPVGVHAVLLAGFGLIILAQIQRRPLGAD